MSTIDSKVVIQRNYKIIKVAVLFLILIGIIAILNASIATKIFKQQEHHQLALFSKHLLNLSIACIFSFAAFRFRYKTLSDSKLAGALLFLLCLLLILAVLIGERRGGSLRWLRLGFASLQPVEFVKLLLVFYLAAYLSKLPLKRLNKFFAGFLPPILITAAISVILLLQPNLSNAIIVLLVGLTMLFIAGAKKIYIALVIIALALSVYFIPKIVRTDKFDYVGERVKAFLEPFDNYRSCGYSVVHSSLALGSGGFFGKGLGRSIGAKFLPSHYSDFIFSIWCEQLGFLGAFIIIALFAILGCCGLRLACLCKDKFSCLLVAGLTLIIILPAWINIAVCTRSSIPTGLPMPFVSYGGSSLCASLISVAFILNIAKQARN